MIELSPADKSQLQHLIGDGRTQQRVARRARALLAMAQRQTVIQSLAEQLEMTRDGIWQLCRRYEQRGYAAVLDLPRSGRPRDFSPSGSSADRAVGLL